MAMLKRYILLTIYLAYVQLILCEINKNTVKSDCGRTKTCLFKPDNCDPFTNCAYFMSYLAPSGNNNNNTGGGTVTLELLAQISATTNQYVAVGFSNDAHMGDDAVTYCMLNDSTPVVGLAYNSATGKSNQIIQDASMANVVKLIEGAVVDSRLFCRISQLVDPHVSDNRVRSLNKPYNILMATGGASPQTPGLRIHNTNPNDDLFPYASGSQMSLMAPLNSAAAPPSEAQSCVSPTVMGRLVKAHGILMIMGWWLFVATAILFARYFRSLWADKKFFGTLIWFNFHRGLNFIGVLMIASAFICIFIVACGKWVGDIFPNHAITGMTASICAFVQPLLAFVRCHPGTSKRPVFNWVHRIIGVGGFCCACYTIFTATDFHAGLHYGRWGSGPMGMIIFYYVAIVVIVVKLEIMISLAERLKRQKVANEIPLSSMRSSEHVTEGVGLMKHSVWNYARLGLLGLFVTISLAVVITLTCFISLN